MDPYGNARSYTPNPKNMDNPPSPHRSLKGALQPPLRAPKDLGFPLNPISFQDLPQVLRTLEALGFRVSWGFGVLGS